MRPFLTANWRYLAMLNFAIDPKILEPLVPTGTELDFHGGRTFASVVGFLFLDTRILGIPIPLHRDFEEVNLRFYVRRRSGNEWRRGVVFVRELVPRRAIALVARTFYGEPYLAVPMRHALEHEDGRLFAEYQWRRGRSWETLAMTARGEPQNAAEGSHEEFITEHYWGYTARRDRCSEYRVEHPRWRLWTAETTKFAADVATLYGPQFVGTLAAEPVSAFIAEGSPIAVYQRNREHPNL
ncbi:MAG: YqjF family protein [Chthoniobacterales bacterium]